MRLLKYFLIFIIAAAVFWLWQDRSPYKTVSGQTMGTYYSVKLKNAGLSSITDKEIRDVLATVNREMSVFDPQSELSKINEAPAGQWIELSEPLQKVMKKAHEIYLLSDKSFDPSIGRLIELWGFAADRHNKRPDDKAIQALRKISGFNQIRFADGYRRLKKNNDEITINLSAIAKGYGVDCVAEKLEQLGIRDYVIEIGGEVRAAGRKSETTDGWNVGIIKPTDHFTENAYIVTVKNHAVATSGDYRNFYYDNGKKYSHTISPQTGYPVESRMVSATVFHKSCMTADGLATALMSMGEEKALAFAESKALAVILFVRDNNGIKALLSTKAKKMLGEK